MTEDSQMPILIVGTGPEARAALDIAASLDVMAYGFIAPAEKTDLTEINDVPVVGPINGQDAATLLEEEHMKILVAEREIPMRKNIVDYLRTKKPEQVTLIHPSAIVSPYAKTGKGCIIHPYVVIQANAMVGSFNLIETGVSIEPDAEIGDFCTLQAGARIGRGAVIQPEVFIGAGAIIGPEVRIGMGAIIGAGSVVLRNVPEGKTMFGNPAKAVG